MSQRHVKHPFGAVITEKARILILGSVPSVKSVENGFYYMHPQNRFWRVLDVLLGEELYSADISTRTEILNRRKIALYDSIEECDILGSSDSKIANVIPADIPALLAESDVVKIFCNGAASYNVFAKFNPQLADMAVKLPSTSPANAAQSLDDLVAAWQVILNYL